MNTAFTPTAASCAAVGVSIDAKALLVSMLRSQSYRELAAVQMLQAAAVFVDESNKPHLLRQQAEEQSHLTAALRIWQDLTGLTADTLMQQARDRLSEKPLPPVRGVLDLAMAQFVFDRAGYFQLREYVACCYAPYAAMAKAIVVEEAHHQEDGGRALVPLALADPTQAQHAFVVWLRASLLSFGRPGSVGDRQALALGLKGRAAALVMQDFVDSLRPVLSMTRLMFPARAEVGLELPEDLRLG